MQMGHMRFEPNINVHITDERDKAHVTAITEIKNLNSFSVLERATAYEIRRQIHEWTESGSLGRKCTMGWNESDGATFVQRDKEEAHDYRYFPDPDLMPLDVSDKWIAALKAQIGELPVARRKRYVESFGLAPADAAILSSDRATGDFYEQAVESGGDPRRVANLLINVVAKLANQQGRAAYKTGIEASSVATVAHLIDEHRLAASNALPLFEALLAKSAGLATAIASSPAEIEMLAESLGLVQTSDASTIDAAIDAILSQNPRPLQDYKAGKQAALGALVGLVMRTAKGLNPQLVQQRLREKLSLSGSARYPQSLLRVSRDRYTHAPMSNRTSLASPPIVAFAGWVLPGAGHWLLGERARGLAIGTTILTLFAMGLLIAGIRVIEVPGYDENGAEVRIDRVERRVEPGSRDYPNASWVLTSANSFLGEIGNKPWFVPQVLAGPVTLVSARLSLTAARQGVPRSHARCWRSGRCTRRSRECSTCWR